MCLLLFPFFILQSSTPILCLTTPSRINLQVLSSLLSAAQAGVYISTAPAHHFQAATAPANHFQVAPSP